MVPTRLRRWAEVIKRDVLAIYFAARDPRVPWYAKVLAVGVAAYALSPIDLIPDFIPIIGYLDDVLLVPLGILLVVRLIPPGLMAEHRARAARELSQPPRSWMGALAVAIVWLAVIALVAWWLAPVIRGLLAPAAAASA